MNRLNPKAPEELPVCRKINDHKFFGPSGASCEFGNWLGGPAGAMRLIVFYCSYKQGAALRLL
jgi:hypothetical protein